MSHHRCNCCGTLACQQPGPCCEPPPEGNNGYGKCTPRGFVKNPDGSWSGSAPSSIHGVVSAHGTFEFFKVVRNFGTPAGFTSRRRLDFAFSNADPRASFVMGSTDTGNPCREYNGGTDFAIPPTIAGEGEPLDPQFEFDDIACTTPDINPIVTVTRLLRSEFRYTPRGDLASGFSWGAGGSGGALGLYQVSVELHECRVVLVIGVGRPAGRPPGFDAVALCEATVFLGNLGGSPAFEVLRAPEAVGVALTPCGTKVRATVNKPIISTPFSDFGGQVDLMCPLPGGVLNPGECRLCRSVGIEMTVEVELADLFTACEKCDLVVQSPCCTGEGMYTPAPRSDGGWVNTPITASWDREIVFHPFPVSDPGYVQTTTQTGSFSGEIVWQPGCPIGVVEMLVNQRVSFPGGEVNTQFTIPIGVRMYGPGAGGPDGRPYLRVEFGEFYGDIGGGFDVHLLRDVGASSFQNPPPGDGVEYVTTRSASRWGTNNVITERATQGSGAVNGDTYTHEFRVGIGPLYPCVLPSGGGGGDSLLLSGAGGGVGGGGCSDCGGGIA